MAIDLKKSYSKVTWDPATKRLDFEPWGKTDDTGRGIIVTLAQNSVITTPTTETLRMLYVKPDGTDGYIPSTIANGKFYIENMSQVFAVPGIVNAEFELYDGAEFIKSVTFNIVVYKSQQSSQIISSNDYTALQEALAEISNLETNYAPRLNSVESQLAEKTTELATIAHNKYSIDGRGYFEKPADFKPTLPCNFFRNSVGVFKHDMDFAKYKTGTKIYVDVVSGNDTTGTGLIGAPYKSLNKACAIASAGAEIAYCITVLSTLPFMRDEMINMAVTNKMIAIVPAVATNRIIVTGGQRGSIYTQDGAGTWKCTRANSYAVMDLRRKDANGVYIPLTNKLTLAECQATINTWYTDNTLVWVHTSDGLVPTETTINVCVGNPAVQLIGTSKLYLENVDFACANNANGGFTVMGDATGATVVGEFCANNCTFASGGRAGNGTGDALACLNVKNTYLFNCFGGYAKADIFNYHFARVPAINRRDCLVVEYNCTGYNAGLERTDQNNNATTCHEGVNILRINSLGYNVKGPTLADIGGCYSICLDCEMKQTLGILGNYYFEANPVGKAIVINSKTDDNAIGLYGDCETLIYNFIGNIRNTGKQVILG